MSERPNYKETDIAVFGETNLVDKLKIIFLKLLSSLKKSTHSSRPIYRNEDLPKRLNK